MFHDYVFGIMFHQEAYTRRQNDIEKQRGRNIFSRC